MTIDYILFLTAAAEVTSSDLLKERTSKNSRDTYSMWDNIIRPPELGVSISELAY